ncbi:hypothetical protein [Paenarthrobacter sp. PH39-S1]|uniref:hypothetical protein n=1 Tax=Paenarthrobacter sp. PH39-S1 TaxID=3046204 RepID=UPI0024B9200B|nr:hypothetical protein [Paenarthrobacter sp. PH39-S1]MDJ0357513.1 hypothetical protein [Paenarthrobacter sp. PH39-S1]
MKTWIKVAGRVQPFRSYGGRGMALTFARTEYFDEDSTTLVAFGPDASLLDPNDRAGVSSALALWRGDLEVLEVAGHNRTSGELSPATWPMQQSGQLTRYLAALQESFGCVRPAGSDYANGRDSFIDGAIESG